jgi:hypothetical protein
MHRATHLALPAWCMFWCLLGACRTCRTQRRAQPSLCYSWRALFQCVKRTGEKVAQKNNNNNNTTTTTTTTSAMTDRHGVALGALSRHGACDASGLTKQYDPAGCVLGDAQSESQGRLEALPVPAPSDACRLSHPLASAGGQPLKGGPFLYKVLLVVP